MDSTQALIATLKNLGSHELVGDLGRVVSWRRYGAGAPLVLLHGGRRRESSPMVNWRCSTAQADMLADLKKISKC